MKQDIGSAHTPNPQQFDNVSESLECTCNEISGWLDPYCEFHTAMHDALRESGAFE